MPSTAFNSLPNLFVIGVPKSGTTTLHAVLDAHPQVYMCKPKEPRFFSRDSEYKKGVEWYAETYFRGSGVFRIRGEATPTYLYLNQKTIPRIQKCLGGQTARFIAIFRNPVDRAYSHYWFNRNTKINRHLQEMLSFEEALATEDQRLQARPELHDEGIISQAYFRTGLYAKQARSFIDAFGRENCLFLLFEDLSLDTFQLTARRIEDFLSVEHANIEYAKKKESIRFRSKILAALIRKSRKIRSLVSNHLPSSLRSKLKSAILDFNQMPFKYPEMRAETRSMLLEKYRPAIREFENILGRDLSHWQ